jgi:HEAT repeat protein
MPLTVLLVVAVSALAGQEPKAEAISAAQVRSAIDRLGDLDFASRMKAAQTVRRAPPPVASPALIDAVSSHADGYVRFKALVLLAGFNDPRATSLMLAALKDPNDRLRSTAYSYFEDHPSPESLGVMLPAFEREPSEFVRPALTRALSAASMAASTPAAGFSKPALDGVQNVMRSAVTRGQDFFRSIAIEALGDHKAAYALSEIVRVAGVEGPLQDDAALAIGKIGNKKGLETLAGLQRTAPRDVQPTIAAAICLLGVNCGSHVGYLIETLRFSVKEVGYQELLRSAANGLGAVAVAGNADALAALFDVGIPSRDPARAPIALAIGTAAIRNPPFILQWLESRTDLADASTLLAEAFDMLEEHYEEERFFVTVRRAYWRAAEGSPARKVAAALIGKLEF